MWQMTLDELDQDDVKPRAERKPVRIHLLQVRYLWSVRGNLRAERIPRRRMATQTSQVRERARGGLDIGHN